MKKYSIIFILIFANLACSASPSLLEKEEELRDGKLSISYRRGEFSLYGEYISQNNKETYRQIFLKITYGKSLLYLVEDNGGSVKKHFESKDSTIELSESYRDDNSFPDNMIINLAGYEESITKDEIGILRLFSDKAFEENANEVMAFYYQPYADYQYLEAKGVQVYWPDRYRFPLSQSLRAVILSYDLGNEIKYEAIDALINRKDWQTLGETLVLCVHEGGSVNGIWVAVSEGLLAIGNAGALPYYEGFIQRSHDSRFETNGNTVAALDALEEEIQTIRSADASSGNATANLDKTEGIQIPQPDRYRHPLTYTLGVIILNTELSDELRLRAINELVDNYDWQTMGELLVLSVHDKLKVNDIWPKIAENLIAIGNTGALPYYEAFLVRYRDAGLKTHGEDTTTFDAIQKEIEVIKTTPPPSGNPPDRVSDKLSEPDMALDFGE